MKVTALAALNCRERNNERGSIGLELRASTTIIATTAAAPPRAVSTTTGDAQLRLLPSVNAYTMPAKPPAARAAPATSTPPAELRSRVSGTWRSVAHTVTAPNGTLMRKIKRQDT